MKRKIPNLHLLALLVLACIPISQLAIDIYLPSLPAMKDELNSTTSLMQFSFTVYILAAGFAQLFYGPISDALGRRSVMLTGLFVFLLGTALCAFSINATMLLIARFIEGVGGGVCFVVSMGIFADLLTGRLLSRAVTYSSLAWSIVPIIAPVIGGFIQQYLGWRFNFYIIFIYASLVFILLWKFLPETLKEEHRQPLRITHFLSSQYEIIKSHVFVGLAVCATFGYGALIAFNVTGPFILQDNLGATAADYGLYVLIVGIAYTIGTYLNNVFLQKINMIYLLGWGASWTMLSGVLLFIFSSLNWFSVTSIILGTCVLQLAQGFVFPNCLSGALKLFTHKNGTVTAVFGFIVLLGCTFISAVISYLHILTQAHLAWVYVILGAIAMVGYLVAAI